MSTADPDGTAEAADWKFTLATGLIAARAGAAVTRQPTVGAAQPVAATGVGGRGDDRCGQRFTGFEWLRAESP